MKREEGKALGLKFYVDGKRCKRGHASVRYTSTGQCCECHASWRGRYWGKYYADNQERIKEQRKNYMRHSWENDHDRLLSLQRKRRRDNPERFRQYAKEWAKKNPEKTRAWHRAIKHRRRAREANAAGSFQVSDIKRIMQAQKRCCAYCKASIKDGYHIDHIVPIAKGGPNYSRNLQLLCAPCNRAKGARDPINHAQTLGLLL